MAREYYTCCGGNSKSGHLGGCDGSTGRAVKSGLRKESYEEAQQRQRNQAKRKKIGKKLRTRPRDAEIAQHCHVEKDAGGYYYIVEDKDQGSKGRTA